MNNQDRPIRPAARHAARLLDAAPVLILAAIAGAGSFVHIRDTAAQHGQHGPMSWAIAICIDLTCAMAARERQRDKHNRRPARRVTWPTIVLTGGVLLSLAANLDQAEPTTWGRITAATPAAAFLTAVSMIERRRTTPHASSAEPSPAVLPVPATDGNVVPVPAPGPQLAGPLLDYARRVAAEHHATHGQPITRDALRTRLGVSNQLASELLRHIRSTTRKAPPMTRLTFPNPVAPAQITDGLRQLADYLDAHPDIPLAPYGWDLLVSTHCDNDTEGRAEVDRIAAILGVPPDDDTADGGHYTAARSFGPVKYYAFHIPASHRARSTSGTDPAQNQPPQAA